MSTRKERALETRNKILEEAFSQFSSQGYLNTTVDQIAEKAGVAKGTVFSHFGTKLNLALEIIKILSDRFIEEIHRYLEEGTSIGEILETLFFQTGNDMDTSLNMTKLLFSISLENMSAKEKKEFTKTVREALEPVFEQASSIFEKTGYKQPLLYSRVFIAILDGIALQLFLEGKEKDVKLISELYGVVKKILGFEIQQGGMKD